MSRRYIDSEAADRLLEMNSGVNRRRQEGRIARHQAAVYSVPALGFLALGAGEAFIYGNVKSAVASGLAGLLNSYLVGKRMFAARHAAQEAVGLEAELDTYRANLHAELELPASDTPET